MSRALLYSVIALCLFSGTAIAAPLSQAERRQITMLDGFRTDFKDELELAKKAPRYSLASYILRLADIRAQVRSLPATARVEPYRTAMLEAIKSEISDLQYFQSSSDDDAKLTYAKLSLRELQWELVCAIRWEAIHGKKYPAATEKEKPVPCTWEEGPRPPPKGRR